MGAQHVAGPMVVIPGAGGVRTGSIVPDSVVVMPEHFDVEVLIRHLVRRRGIFDAPVLDADIAATGAASASPSSNGTVRRFPLPPGPASNSPAKAYTSFRRSPRSRPAAPSRCPCRYGDAAVLRGAHRGPVGGVDGVHMATSQLRRPLSARSARSDRARFSRPPGPCRGSRGGIRPCFGPARPSMRSTPIAWASAYSSRRARITPSGTA